MRPRTARVGPIPRLSRGRARTARQRFEPDGRPRSALSWRIWSWSGPGSSTPRAFLFFHRLERTARVAPIPRRSRGRGGAPHGNYDTTTPAFPLREPFGARHPPTPVNGDEDARHRSKTGLQTSESTLSHLERQVCKPRKARCHTWKARRANLGKDVAKPRKPGVQTSKTIWTNPRRCFDKPEMSYSFSWKNSRQT